jgi:hypothetical protein
MASEGIPKWRARGATAPCLLFSIAVIHRLGLGRAEIPIAVIDEPQKSDFKMGAMCQSETLAHKKPRTRRGPGQAVIRRRIASRPRVNRARVEGSGTAFGAKLTN